MSKPRNHINGSCVNCDIVEKYMMRVGAFIICNHCFLTIFQTDDPVKKERKKYLKFLDIWYTKCD